MEKTLTKYFWVLNLVTLAVVAYFLADGTGELVAAQISKSLPSSEPTSLPVEARTNRRTNPIETWTPDGSAILTRNIFDSTFLEGQGDDQPDSDDVDLMSNENEIPLVPCSDGKVNLLATVAADNDPEWSFATISEGKEPRLCRVGDRVGDKTVSWITWRYIFLKSASEECYLDMFAGPGDNKPTMKRNWSAPLDNTPESADVSEIMNGIKVISDTERVVDRSVINKVMTEPSKFIRSVRIRPQREEDGSISGFKLRRFDSGSPLELLGAQRGDVIQAVNGVKLTSVDEAMGAYQKLQTMNELTFSILRDGKPVEMKIRIK